jgi:hypothetical protein
MQNIYLRVSVGFEEGKIEIGTEENAVIFQSGIGSPDDKINTREELEKAVNLILKKFREDLPSMEIPSWFFK